MQTRIQLGDISINIVRKKIKNIHMSVLPPDGRVRVAVPERMNIDSIRVFTISKLSWIKRQQKKISEQERETIREYINRETHYVWGCRCLLSVVDKKSKPSVELHPNKIILNVRPKTAINVKHEILASWYRAQIKIAVRILLKKWQPLIGVQVERFFVRQMKTKWGSCNPSKGSIRLNTELGKKPPECLEYILVHEMVHLIERTHNNRFIALMDRFMPRWRYHRDLLNRLPLSYVDWEY